MSRDFIDKVRALIMSHISDEKFGKQNLASLLRLSPWQTLRKVKAATGKSVNQYIRELRLEKAAKLIKNTDHTIAEVSYQVGFESPSYFNNSFVKYYGITPGEYKTQSFTLSELATKKAAKEPKTNFTKKKIVYILSLVLLTVIGHLLIDKIFSKDTILSHSIAVLPFKDLSPDDAQWFSDGVSDNILSSLSQIKELTVISFTSSSTYTDTDKQIPEIAKELGVSYILEGSVTLLEDKVKIIAQLINKNDELVWSKEYDESFDDIIAIQNNVAEEVMKLMEVTLTHQEEIVFKKYPTENMEAYNLYLKGRLVNGNRSKKDLELNIELNKKAISLDSTFSEAYGEVASSYLQLSKRYSSILNPFKARADATYYADKALEIDPNTTRALTVKGNLYCYIDWDKSIEYFEKAIEANPNDALLRLQYSLNFILSPDNDAKRNLEEAAIAHQLNPLSRSGSLNYLISLINNKQLEEAEEILKKCKFLLNESNLSWWENYIKAFKTKDWTFLKSKYETLIEEDPCNPEHYISLALYYRSIEYDYSRAFTLVEQAFHLDSNYIGLYTYGLILTEKYKEAKELMSSSIYVSELSNLDQLWQLWLYNYQKEDYNKALEVLNDSVFRNQYWERTITHASMGDRIKVDSMNKKYPWGTGRETDWRGRRAILHAALKDRDSMYYYLENLRFISWAKSVNEFSKEFDPYRNEDRFKAFLKKWYLPVSSE